VENIGQNNDDLILAGQNLKNGRGGFRGRPNVSYIEDAL
jgi:hypothetical protein